MITARFKAPRGGFGSSRLDALAKTWTDRLEAEYGHDLINWKLLYKSSPEYGFQSKCRKCGMKFLIEHTDRSPQAAGSAIYPAEGGAALTPENTAAWAAGAYCELKPEELIRGLNVAVDDRAFVLAQPPAEVARTLLKATTSSGLGKSWTNVHNRDTAAAYAKGFHHGNKDGIPVILHARFHLSDQRRNYVPARFVTLEGFEGESEVFLGKNEVMRVHTVEWWDGEKWVEQSVPETKAKTAELSDVALRVAARYQRSLVTS